MGASFSKKLTDFTSSSSSQDYQDVGFIPAKCNTSLPEYYEYLGYFTTVMNQNQNKNFELILNSYDITSILDKQNIADLTESEVRNVYSICSILAHKYIWSNPDKPNNKIPQCLAKPWYESANTLGIPPVLTHAAVDLWNWKLKDPSRKFELDNLKSTLTLCDEENAKKSEEWFYLIMVAIEGECGSMVSMFDILMQEFAREEFSFTIINKNMVKIRERLAHQKKLMSRMREHCKPELFYNVLRKYLWGSDKVDGGVWLKGVEKVSNDSDTSQYLDVLIEYGGGSAAQSSLIQAEDIFFGIKHPNDEFLKRMRDYMPEKHRKQLISMEERINMREFMETRIMKSSYDYQMLLPVYNDCIELIADFRKIHKGVVAEYIIKQMPRDIDGTGTGGTPLQSYLREKVQETENTKMT